MSKYDPLFPVGFQASFKPDKMTLKLMKFHVIDVQLI